MARWAESYLSSVTYRVRRRSSRSAMHWLERVLTAYPSVAFRFFNARVLGSRSRCAVFASRQGTDTTKVLACSGTTSIDTGPLQVGGAPAAKTHPCEVYTPVTASDASVFASTITFTYPLMKFGMPPLRNKLPTAATISAQVISFA